MNTMYITSKDNIIKYEQLTRIYTIFNTWYNAIKQFVDRFIFSLTYYNKHKFM